jgi:hypothetical protein
MDEVYSNKAHQVWREYGLHFGWSLEKCQMLVEDYEDDKNYREPEDEQA